MHRGLLEATGNVAAENLVTASGTDFAGAETRLPRGGQKHAREEIRSPRDGGLRTRENFGSRSRNAVVSVSWGPPCLPGATPSNLFCCVASSLLVCPFTTSCLPPQSLLPSFFFFFFCSSSSSLQSQKRTLRPANRQLPVFHHFVSLGLICFKYKTVRTSWWLSSKESICRRCHNRVQDQLRSSRQWVSFFCQIHPPPIEREEYDRNSP